MSAPTPQRRRDDRAIPLRTVAQGAIVCWAIIATLATIGLWIQSHASETALERATVAVKHSNEATARAQIALHNAISARTLATAIQTERSGAIGRDCKETNARHDATIRQLDRLIAVSVRHAKTRQQRVQIEQSRAGTTLLINALDPAQNCKQVAARDAPPVK